MLNIRVMFGGILISFSFLYFGGGFIPLRLLGYGMIIANSYPTRAPGIIIVKHQSVHKLSLFNRTFQPFCAGICKKITSD